MKKLLIILGLLVLLLGVKMTSDPVLYPQILEDTPFPGQEVQDINVTTTSAGNSIPTTTTDKKTPKKIIAHETISQSLNTLSKKINGVFEFLKMGAIKIGEYINGVSGEIKISPDGIVARNKSGVTTFAIDGDTGDATFKGNVQAADFTVIDEDGLISLSNFDLKSAQGGPGLTYVEEANYINLIDTANSNAELNSLEFSLSRSVNVFIAFSIISGIGRNNEGLDGSGRVFYRLNDNIDDLVGSWTRFYYDTEIKEAGAIDIHENILAKPYTSTCVVNLSPGDHVIKIQGKVESLVNIYAHVLDYNVSLIILGK